MFELKMRFPHSFYINDRELAMCPSTTIFQHTIKEVLKQMIIINGIISMESPIGSCEC